MIYYAQIECGAHFLYAHELAEYFLEKYGWASKNGAPAKLAVSKWLNSRHDAREIGNPKLFFETRNGLKRVYQYGLVDLELLDSCLYNNTKGACSSVEIDGKTYTFYNLKIEEQKRKEEAA